jgi:hypothetical protein
MSWKLGVGLLVATGALGAAGCGSASIRPQSFADPAVPCPAGLISWKLDILDRRAQPEDSEKAMASIRKGIEDSFPGCKWSAGGGGGAAEAGGAPTVTITVHRLGVSEHDRYQYAAAEWTVNASTSSGSTMTEFDADEEDSRPAYRDADEEALNEAFRKALQRTVRGLAAMQRLGSVRPREGTFMARASVGTAPPNRTLSR